MSDRDTERCGAPRPGAGTFSPQIVKKRQRRLNGVDEVVLSPYVKGLTIGEISAHFAEIDAVAHGKRHPHPVRFPARVWIRVIWRC